MWRHKIQFQLQERLGEGGQGRVFKALRKDRTTGMEQSVAVKILHSRTAVALWKAEFESLAKIRSPYCVQVHAFERVRGKPALILELVNGVSLAELGRTCLLSASDCEEIVAQIQQGLLHLQKNGMAHGDLSPQNVLLDINGHIRLLDFGLANGICEETSMRLTRGYAAPERLNAKPADFQSDLFSLGKIEQYLLGQMGSEEDKDSPLLQLNPEDRKMRDIFPDPQRQRELELKIKTLLDRRQTATRTYAEMGASERQTSTARWINPLLVTAFFLICGEARTNLPVSDSFLSIRTHKWHKFFLNGDEIGYSPIRIALKENQDYRLEWVSASGKRGIRRFHVGRNEWRELVDRDFSH